MKVNSILLVGTGPMAVDYCQVLKAMNLPFFVVGRGEVSAKMFQEKTGIKPITGGLQGFLKGLPPFEVPSKAIVAVGVESLAENTIELLVNGVSNILVEKPGGITKKQIETVVKITKETNSKVYLAYNRRFYASVDKAIELITEDGGLDAMHFEFTEWSHKIELLNKPTEVFSNWFLANSTHVADLAFFIAGKPKEISCYVSGGNQWHPSSTIFTGAGITEDDVLFSYQAHWESAGRWSIELLTTKGRYYLKPMEKLFFQKTGTLELKEVPFDDSIDSGFKPGLYNEVLSWTEDIFERHITIGQQLEMMSIYNKIGGYK